MSRPNFGPTTIGARVLLSSLCLLVLQAAPFDSLAENTNTGAVIPDRSLIGRLVGVEGRIEFTDHQLGRRGVAKDEVYVIQRESGEHVRVVLRDDTLVEPQVEVGDRVLAFFDEHGRPTTIWKIP